MSKHIKREPEVVVSDQISYQITSAISSTALSNFDELAKSAVRLDVLCSVLHGMKIREEQKLTMLKVLRAAKVLLGKQEPAISIYFKERLDFALYLVTGQEEED